MLVGACKCLKVLVSACRSLSVLVGGCGGEKTFLLHGGCFKYLMSVAKEARGSGFIPARPQQLLGCPAGAYEDPPAKERLQTRSGRADRCATAHRMCKGLLATGLGLRRFSVGSIALLSRIVNSPS